MSAIISLLVILTLSLLVTRLATAALTLTGMSLDMAKLQSVSAFSGVGFTTGESEAMTQHPVRRRILMGLMIVGNIGVLTALASLTLSFISVNREQGFWRLLWLLAGLSILWVIMLSSWIDHHMHRLMRWLLRRWSDLDVRDYASLLQLTGDYAVRELRVEEGNWIDGRRLDQANLFDEGLTVLGVWRPDGEYLGVPRGETQVRAGDVLLLYGEEKNIRQLNDRWRGHSGDREHDHAVDKHQTYRRAQRAREQDR